MRGEIASAIVIPMEWDGKKSTIREATASATTKSRDGCRIQPMMIRVIAPVAEIPMAGGEIK